MTFRRRAYFDLIRVPNAVGAVADPIAGFLFVGGGMADWRRITAVAVTSALLYAGGVILNDLCDVDRDARERPERPIPAGQITRRRARGLALAFLSAGLLICLGLSIRSLFVASALVACIILYDSVLKNTLIAPALMGLCRALNLLLGASVITEEFKPSALAPAGLMWLYVTSVTFFARKEAAVSSRTRIGISLGGILFAVAGLGGLPLLMARRHPAHLIGVAAVALILMRRGIKAVASPEPEHVQAAVASFVSSLVLFDAVIVWAARGWVAATAVALLYAAVVMLARRYRVT